MKISFLIPAIVLYVVRVVFSNSVHVGTVLFTTTDVVKKCWTESDKCLLKARLVMQDVLPDPDCIDFSNPNAIAILLDYFHSCFQIISTATYGRIQNLMYLALADALGGYLRAYVLPFTRMAYYAGTVKYTEAKKLFQLYDDIRVFLKTNGVGWVEPQRVCVPNFHIKPLVITGGALEACKHLYIIEKEGKLHSMNIHHKKRKNLIKKKKAAKKKTRREAGFQSEEDLGVEKFKPKREKCEDYNFCNSTLSGNDPILKSLVESMENSSTCHTLCNTSRSEEKLSGGSAVRDNSAQPKRVIVPLPMLDDCEFPRSIAIPFKKRPFRSLTSPDSAFILEYYYLSVVKCFIAKGNSRADIKSFNSQFHAWLTSQVTPHLCEEQWYPAFGGVLRILQTIKKFGAENSGKDTAFHDIAFLFSDGAEFPEVESEYQMKDEAKIRDVSELDTAAGKENRRHVLIAMAVASIFWLFVFCALWFFFQARRQKRKCCAPSKSTSKYDCTSTSQRSCHQEQQQQQQNQPPCKNVNFQFLIRFFKRKECAQDLSSVRCSQQKIEQKCVPKECVPKESVPKECVRKRRRSSPHCPKKKKTCAYPVELHTMPYDKAVSQKRVGPSVEEPKKKIHGHGDQLQMLWKKPSNRAIFKEGREERWRRSRFGTTVSEFVSVGRSGVSSYDCSKCQRDESQEYTTEKQSTTSYSRESLQSVSTTASSTMTEEGELSSATMEYFEEVTARQKERKTSKQSSMEKSGCESYSSTVG